MDDPLDLGLQKRERTRGEQLANMRSIDKECSADKGKDGGPSCSCSFFTRCGPKATKKKEPELLWPKNGARPSFAFLRMCVARQRAPTEIILELGWTGYYIAFCIC